MTSAGVLVDGASLTLESLGRVCLDRAIVELDEQSGLRLMTNVVGCAAEAVHIGMRVRVVFEEYEDVWIPLFEPVEA